MKTFLKIIISLVLILVVTYFLGPKPAAPNLQIPVITLPESLTKLEQQINESEAATPGLKPDNNARIVWADSTKKEKTKIAFLYLHGFTASPADATPVLADVAKEFNANLYSFRNAHHGVDLGDSTMLNATADDFIYATERALAIAKKLGDEVIVMGTSLGGALTLYLASKHPEIKAIVLYAPATLGDNTDIKIISGPWGYQIAKLGTGSEFRDNPDTIKIRHKYFQMHVHMNGVIAVANFVRHTMKKETFERIKCPVFLGYYYKNEKEHDNAVDVATMLKMFNELGTPKELKKEMNFPESGDHVIASAMISKDWKHVEEETVKWLRETVVN